jgi:hypothetical protein
MWCFLHNVRRNGSEPATQLPKWLLTAGAIFAAALPITQAHAEKDKAAYKEGKEQEARQDYEAAYEDCLLSRNCG